MLAAACNVTVPMATAEILLDFFRAVEGEVDGGGIGGGLTGTAAAAACSLSPLCDLLLCLCEYGQCVLPLPYAQQSKPTAASSPEPASEW